jgi:hypothetical protein
MLLSPNQNVGQNWDIKIANRSFENVSQFKYRVRHANFLFCMNIFIQFGDDSNKPKFIS